MNSDLELERRACEEKENALYAQIYDLKQALKTAIDDFVAEVERRAESNMMKTGKLEGAHYAAMKQYQSELSEKRR